MSMKISPVNRVTNWLKPKPRIPQYRLDRVIGGWMISMFLPEKGDWVGLRTFLTKEAADTQVRRWQNGL